MEAIGNAPRPARALAALAVAATLALTVAFATGPAADDAAAGVATPKKEVLLVGNNWDGTVDAVDQRTFERLARINVVPDFDQRMASVLPWDQLVIAGNRELAGEGHDQLVDDIRVSLDGLTLYASRPSFNDAVAIDIASGDLLWRYSVTDPVENPNHFRSDHMAISPDRTQLAVSVTIGNQVDIIDAGTGLRVDQFPTGDFAHENEYSRDGELIYNGSIGRVITPDFEFSDASKGERLFTIADTGDYEVQKTIEFPQGVRPFVVMPNGKKVYVQLSFFHGFVEYSIARDKLLRTKKLPMQEAKDLPRSEYPLDSAHHGLALSGNRKRLCDAGTVADYVAIIKRRLHRRKRLKTERIIEVGDKPYWATTSGNGKLCFLANSDSDDVSVVRYRKPKEIERFEVGDHPQRLRVAEVRLP
jgi:DNA-binding beta-propeller fold protein YncE